LKTEGRRTLPAGDLAVALKEWALLTGSLGEIGQAMQTRALRALRQCIRRNQSLSSFAGKAIPFFSKGTA